MYLKSAEDFVPTRIPIGGSYNQPAGTSTVPSAPAKKASQVKRSQPQQAPPAKGITAARKRSTAKPISKIVEQDVKPQLQANQSMAETCKQTRRKVSTRATTSQQQRWQSRHRVTLRGVEGVQAATARGTATATATITWTAYGLVLNYIN